MFEKLVSSETKSWMHHKLYKLLGTSDLRYTFPRLHQSAKQVKCLDHAQYAVKQGCVRQRDALTCISKAIFTVM